MTSLDPQTITRLLAGVRAGEEDAARSLLPAVYAELQGLARRIFSTERGGHTLQPTALVHEAWIKLADHLQGALDRRHFFVIAGRAMRQVLTDHARAVMSQKRGEGRGRVTLDEAIGSTAAAGFDPVELDDTLTRLARLNARHARVVELRVLAGLTIPETAEALGVSHFTVEKDWFVAKAWLRTELAGGG